ncbi:hypothetical protein D3C81_1382320 [compost metagenome]
MRVLEKAALTGKALCIEEVTNTGWHVATFEFLSVVRKNDAVTHDVHAVIVVCPITKLRGIDIPMVELE